MFMFMASQKIKLKNPMLIEKEPAKGCYYVYFLKEKDAKQIPKIRSSFPFYSARFASIIEKFFFCAKYHPKALNFLQLSIKFLTVNFSTNSEILSFL